MTTRLPVLIFEAPSSDERFAFEQSLKVYRDNKNVMDCAIEEASKMADK